LVCEYTQGKVLSKNFQNAGAEFFKFSTRETGTDVVLVANCEDECKHCGSIVKPPETLRMPKGRAKPLDGGDFLAEFQEKAVETC
jgi:hypothetical protein